MTYFSVVIPIKNEQDNIEPLLNEVQHVMDTMGQPWEVICIDDGSDDGSLALLRQLKERLPQLRLIVFSRNYGQTSAFAAGFAAATGEWVITLDGDGQNDPKDIPSLFAKAQEGYDLVVGRRHKRQDLLHRKLLSRLGNWARETLCSDGVEDTGCSLKIYRKKALEHIKLFRGMHRFLPALFSIEGFSVTQVDVNHRPRTKGNTKYSLRNRSFNTIADLLAVFWMRKRHLEHKGHEE